MKLSICTGTHEHGLVGWKNIEVNSHYDIESAVKTYNYAAFGVMKNGYKKADNVISMSNCAMFDIDNDPETNHLSIKDAIGQLSDITFYLVTSRSHRLIKGDKPAVDRYRIIVPLNIGLTKKKENYRLEMMILAKQLGLLDCVDHKALKDIARFYYKSPSSAIFIANDAGASLDIEPIINAVIAELAETEKRKQEQRDAITNRIIPLVSDFNIIDLPKIININAINSLPLDVIYTAYTGNRLIQEGSYLMGKGITEGTSKSRHSFTIWQENGVGNWLWHDLKTSESGNVLTFMRFMGMNAFEAARELQNKYGCNLLLDNPAYYAKKINAALEVATNDRSLQEQIKLSTGANFVKIEKDQVRIADKTFTFSQLGINKGEMINRLKENRVKNINEINGLK